MKLTPCYNQRYNSQIPLSCICSIMCSLLTKWRSELIIKAFGVQGFKPGFLIGKRERNISCSQLSTKIKERDKQVIMIAIFNKRTVLMQRRQNNCFQTQFCNFTITMSKNRKKQTKPMEEKPKIKSKLSLRSIQKTSQSTTIIAQNSLQVSPKQKQYLSGILQKEAPGLFGLSQKRYCSLQDNKFIYREDAQVASPASGILHFGMIFAKVCPHKNGDRIAFFSIKVVGSDKQFIFKGDTYDLTEKWVKEIQAAINRSDGKKAKMTYLAPIHRFWRKDHISEKQLRQTARTGDLILFRGKKRSAVLQRTLTREEYDHVALVIMNMRGEILLFQAVGFVGVTVCSWKQLVKKKWFQQQEIMTHRSLEIHRSEAFLNEVQQFVYRNLGKKYNFSVSNYLFNQQDSGIEDNNTYFCSSLIAKLYKTLGLLDDKNASESYLPSHFSTKNKLVLDESQHYGKGFLQPQKIIVFEEFFFEK